MAADRVLGRGGSRDLRRPAVDHARPPSSPGLKPIHGHILSLQRAAGNQAVGRLFGSTTSRAAMPAVQRAVTILRYNVGKGGPDDAVLDVGAVRTAIQAAVRAPDQATVLANLVTADAQGWQGADVPTLATHLCLRTRHNPVNAVADAIGSTLTAQGTNADEARQFEQARVAATSMSRTKGTPNQIALASLDRAMHTDIAGITQQIAVLDGKLATRQDSVSETMVESWPDGVAAGAVNVREAHGNGAGWLPVVDVATPLAAFSATVDQAYVAANAGWKAQKGEPAVRFALITSKRIFPDPQDRRYYVWASHAAGVSPYIEFSIPGHKDLRVVFDFVNRRYYFTVHYKWYKGYSPFFLIT